MSQVAVLMYHRVCERGADTACYFARGTAITPENFAAQMRHLAGNARVIPLEELGDVRAARPGESEGRPRVVLTFDDGYADVRDRVLPVCAALGLRFSVFPMAGHHAHTRTLAWVDHYYALLHRARRRADLDLGAVFEPGAARELEAPGLDRDLRWWVRGPFKRALRDAEPEVRERMLERLATAIDAPIDGAALARTLYLGPEDLDALLDGGVEVGGHGVHHLRLADCQDAHRDAEIAGSVALLDGLGVSTPRWFSYPDGSHDPAVAARVATAGFAGAFTVEPGFVRPETHAFAMPRFLARNAPPSSPAWCGAALGGP